MTTTPSTRNVDVADVRRRHPIQQVIAAAGVELHPRGRGWMACCPFHEDSTASMSVAGVADLFHCFGCGASGDVIDFVARTHAVGFREAVQILENPTASGMPPSPVPLARPGRDVVKSTIDLDPQRGFQINAMAWQWFSRPVPHAFATSYLRHHRGIDLRAAERQLGHALVGHTGHGWTPLVDHLRTCCVTDDELLAMDLAQPSRQDQLIDTLRDRLIVPVTHPDGRISGFVGRDTSGHPRAPKYRNPTHTATFDKSESLYRPTHPTVPDATVIVVEGVLDALAVTAAATGARLPEHLAPCSTLGVTVSAGQARRVVSLTSEPIVIALDGDQAGTEGTLRWVDAICRQARRLALVTRLPDGLDPADWLTRHGATGLAALTPAQRHTPLDTAELQAARPHLPARELAVLACTGSHPVHTVVDDLQRLAPLLHPGAIDELVTGVIAEMTRHGWNINDSVTRELHEALSRRGRPPPPRAIDTRPLPTPHLRDLR